MPKDGRYDTTGLDEAQFQSGSQDTVLKNLLGIANQGDMEQAETLALFQTTENMFDRFDQDHRFTVVDIRAMHHEWLGDIYSWAGNYRQVMMSREGFPFASPAFIPELMAEFEQKILSRQTPCKGDDDTVAESLAIVHAELVLIHPFREGNGRLARMLAMLMGLQAGLPILVFDEMEAERLEAYLAAVRAGMGHDYGPLKGIFGRIIERSRNEA
jgi:cell filamentation protein